MLLDGLQQKCKYTQGQQRGVGDLGLQNIFTKLKMSHRLTQVPTISNVFEFDLKWKKSFSNVNVLHQMECIH
jgi:hypothetical protein